MAKKKLLNEATVRRFMGLAGMESSLVSNKINEMGMMGKSYKKHYGDEKKMEEGSYVEEDMDEGAYGKPMEEDLYEEEDMKARDGVPPEMDDMDDDMEGDDIKELTPEDLSTLQMMARELPSIVAKLGDEADDDMGMDDPEDDDMDMDDPEGDEKVIDEEALSEVELQLSEDEIVQEVAKRVAKRILKAKKAKSQLDEALGRTRKRR